MGGGYEGGMVLRCSKVEKFSWQRGAGVTLRGRGAVDTIYMFIIFTVIITVIAYHLATWWESEVGPSLLPLLTGKG